MFNAAMVKEKPNSIRTYDEDGFRRRGACVCFKDESEEEVLLVTSKKSPDLWVVPGGGIEPTEDPRVAAERECFEEAGVKGAVKRKLGVFENKDRKHRTYVFVLHVEEMVDHWEEKTSLGRQRKWFSLEEAKAKLSAHKPVQCEYLSVIPNGRLS
ncbi:diphosphoinositol polyphosphate phosphohydrolase 2 [Lingula anatina]|uniref:diphosphoinositol-polyphosphate diphosphatase n=1 Tax=Lingula anatina TaxID=7574 RepID=A0A1S3KAF5_LINAN|nr:diphosphoinositol polyphosphate phosphohydrolase 2 [Lingula anatina]|eukprot:XP_013419477.1 diphosphoinositol polyphosphate phosphohydrolase 2 [Lingula anatina]